MNSLSYLILQECSYNKKIILLGFVKLFKKKKSFTLILTSFVEPLPLNKFIGNYIDNRLVIELLIDW